MKLVVPDGRVEVNAPATVVDTQTEAPTANADVSNPEIMPNVITWPNALFAIVSSAIATEGSVVDELARASAIFGTFPVEPVT